ncbi:serine/threonine protein kinase [Dokdonella sp.]|uniref:serine/threonine protein kinase n=1 Tax=Dokdonella sp. TaxID=2291710 RepID=UPI0025C6376B|nr:serine/threonine protein kinase [Dokdonella sp.]MBX3690931.1 serine/threonine protein kinase [Dokdonella sp.]MCW5566804.1 serine/threonine protein kinase [Dokdonella sp.]
MENDDLKAAWQTLNRRLEREDANNLGLLREKKLDRTRSSLRPLFWGQVAQALFGVPFILFASLLWMRAHALPEGLPLTALIAGIIVQVYGIATVAFAGETIRRIREIDYAAPVVAIQKQLAALRRTYIISGMVAGLPWWFLWVPLLAVLAGLGGVDLHAKAPGVIWIGLGLGAAGLLATAWFHRWSRDPARPRLARVMDAAVTGASLRRARAQIEELERFERG